MSRGVYEITQADEVIQTAANELVAARWVLDLVRHEVTYASDVLLERVNDMLQDDVRAVCRNG